MIHPDYSKAILYILRLRSWSCLRCGDPAVKPSLETYKVHDWKKRVIAQVVCHQRRHKLGSRSINLSEVRFVHDQELWKRRPGPRLPGGPR